MNFVKRFALRAPKPHGTALDTVAGISTLGNHYKKFYLFDYARFYLKQSGSSIFVGTCRI